MALSTPHILNWFNVIINILYGNIVHFHDDGYLARVLLFKI